jgi:hypothetical protein
LLIWVQNFFRGHFRSCLLTNVFDGEQRDIVLVRVFVMSKRNPSQEVVVGGRFGKAPRDAAKSAHTPERWEGEMEVNGLFTRNTNFVSDDKNFVSDDKKFVSDGTNFVGRQKLYIFCRPTDFVSSDTKFMSSYRIVLFV